MMRKGRVNVLNNCRSAFLVRIFCNERLNTLSISLRPLSFSPQWMKSGSSAENMQPLNYTVILTGDTHKFHRDFIDALNRETLCLREVSTEQESDFILHFRFVSALSDSHTDGQNYSKRTDKPVVLVVLHNTLDSNSVPNSSECVNNPDVFIVDCIFCDFEGLRHCQINRNAVIAVSHWLNTKMKSLRTVRPNANEDEHKTVAPSSSYKNLFSLELSSSLTYIVSLNLFSL
ncbi:hypothetical protein IRJ41_023246 [Triplophysa rosa]|uniref:Uncharacterized protein n=1 Tax=Triplophysa rosa TaxID=992332 RepID=A0A9W7X2Z0_TRIRA|nr:hypothetical protein IRJ41_023246 [Triplophysa rosa]